MLTKHIGENVCVRGWLTGKRSSGSMLFLQLRDGSGFLQGVLERSLVGENCWAAAQKLTNESSCFVCGTDRADDRAPSGTELSVSDLTTIHAAENFPIGRKQHGPEFLFNLRQKP